MSEEQDNTQSSSLDEQLRQHVQKTGKLSSADIATFTKQNEDEKPKGAAMAEETKIEPHPQQLRTDPLVEAGEATPGTGELIQDASNATREVQAAQELMSTIRRRRDLKITPADKEAFLTALITNGRMQLPFELCGGKIKGIIRSRTIAESRAIIARQLWEMNEGIIKTQLDHTVRMRSMMMSAQIAELNGKTYPEMEEPLLPVAAPKGEEEKEPGWAKWIDTWAEQAEAMHQMLWDRIVEFEDKYWRMVEDAADQDFWRPAAST